MATEREIEEIKSRVNIYDIISSYLTLKKSGANYFGLCPFHTERSPSFSVNAELGFFKCFGCQESGDVITFIEKVENLSFSESIEKLAQIAGVTLSQDSRIEKSDKKKILEMNALANEVFKYMLLKHTAGTKAREYLQMRHINNDSIREFSLGFDCATVLVSVFRKRGYTDQDILKYGFGVTRQGRIVDKYRNRIIFPIYSISGDVVGFSGRIFTDQKNAPKYINSPETDAFKKSTILFGLFQTKKYIKEKDNAILLEGPVDVIASYQNGVKNVCAVQGTSLTVSHLMILKRMTQNISFCFDQDAAGYTALKRSYVIAQQAELTTKVIHIHYAKDVDEKVNKDNAGFLADMNNPIDVIDFFITKGTQEFNISTIEGKLGLIQSVLPFIASISEETKKNFYIQSLAKGAQVEESDIRGILTAKYKDGDGYQFLQIEKKNERKTPRLEYLLALIVQYFDTIRDDILEIQTGYIQSDNAKVLIEKLKEGAAKKIPIKEFINASTGNEKEQLLSLMTKHISIKESENEVTFVRSEIISLQKLLRKQSIRTRITTLKNALRTYEQDHDEEKIMETVRKIGILSKEIQE